MQHKLSEPYPDLPPFDPAQVGKYPYQDEIEAYIAQAGGVGEAEALGG